MPMCKGALACNTSPSQALALCTAPIGSCPLANSAAMAEAKVQPTMASEPVSACTCQGHKARQRAAWKRVYVHVMQGWVVMANLTVLKRHMQVFSVKQDSGLDPISAIHPVGESTLLLHLLDIMAGRTVTAPNLCRECFGCVHVWTPAHGSHGHRTAHPPPLHCFHAPPQDHQVAWLCLPLACSHLQTQSQSTSSYIARSK